jgi:hypothetical protein
MEQHLPSKGESLSSNPHSTTKKKKKSQGKNVKSCQVFCSFHIIGRRKTDSFRGHKFIIIKSSAVPPVVKVPS